jgi:hypothetical protein
MEVNARTSLKLGDFVSRGGAFFFWRRITDPWRRIAGAYHAVPMLAEDCHASPSAVVWQVQVGGGLAILDCHASHAMSQMKRSPDVGTAQASQIVESVCLFMEQCGQVVWAILGILEAWGSRNGSCLMVLAERRAEIHRCVGRE